jgi:hypothetical protein
MITEDVAERLDRSLDRVFCLVRDGQLSDLPAALAEMEAELGAAHGPGIPVTEAALVRLRRKADRNAACLKGAARGLRAARRRIAEVRAAATGLAAYDANGQRLDTADPGARINRRF